MSEHSSASISKDVEVADVEVKEHGAPDARDADEGLEALKEVEQTGLVLDEATRKKIVRRADMIIMPLICFIYGAQYLDRTCLSYASIMGMLKDLKLETWQYSWMASIFFFSYLGMNLINGRILQRFPIGKYLSICTVLWGIIVSCYAAVNSYSAALAVRFCLGIVQACVSPALVLIVGQWYTKPEQVTRTSFWMCANGLATIFGSLIAYGIATGFKSNPSAWSIAPWRAVMVIFGVITIVIGFVAFFTLPSNQLSAKWLSHSERTLAVERVRENQSGIGNKKFKWNQFKEVFTDPFSWTLLIFSFASTVPLGALANYFSQIIVSFGFNPVQALLYGAPTGAVSIALLLIWGVVARRYNCRILGGLVCQLIALIGASLVIGLPTSNSHGRLAGYYLTAGIAAGDGAILSVISANVAGYTKKTTIASFFFALYCAGNIIGPQMFQAKDKPEFRPAIIGICVTIAICALDMVAMVIILKRRNAEKQRIRDAPGYVKPHGSEFWDLTDRENPEFVYVY